MWTGASQDIAVFKHKSPPVMTGASQKTEPHLTVNMALDKDLENEHTTL